jgi:hypothetical protein
MAFIWVGLGQTDTANFQQMVQRSRQHAANTPKLRKQTAGQLDGIFSGHPAHQANTQKLRRGHLPSTIPTQSRPRLFFFHPVSNNAADPFSVNLVASVNQGLLRGFTVAFFAA